VKRHGAVQFGSGGGGPSRTYGGKRVRAKGNERFRDRPGKGKGKKRR
jgi:hypothetical protein